LADFPHRALQTYREVYQALSQYSDCLPHLDRHRPLDAKTEQAAFSRPGHSLPGTPGALVKATKRRRWRLNAQVSSIWATKRRRWRLDSQVSSI
jgi:hypothetical protein